MASILNTAQVPDTEVFSMGRLFDELERIDPENKYTEEKHKKLKGLIEERTPESLGQSIDMVETYFDQNPDDPPQVKYLVGKAGLAASGLIKDYDKMELLSRKCLATLQDDIAPEMKAVFLFFSGVALKHLRKPMEALQSFEEGLASHPNQTIQVLLLSSKAQTHNLLSQYEQAIQTCRRFIDLYPKDRSKEDITYAKTMHQYKFASEALGRPNENWAINPQKRSNPVGKNPDSKARKLDADDWQDQD